MSAEMYTGNSAGVAKKPVQIFVGKLMQVPEGDLTEVALSAATLGRFFSVSNDCGSTFTPPDIRDHIEVTVADNFETVYSGGNGYAGLGGNYASDAVGDYAALGATVRNSIQCSISLNFTNGSGKIKINDAEHGTSYSGTLQEGDIINVIYYADASAEPDASYDITVYVDAAEGTPQNFDVSSTPGGGITVKPMICAEPSTWSSILLTALRDISALKISAEYHTESGCDTLDMTVGTDAVLDGASGDSSMQQRFSGSLTAGQSIYLRYEKDYSVDADNESATAFEITCDPILDGEITGYTPKNLAVRANEVYTGDASGKAKRIL